MLRPCELLLACVIAATVVEGETDLVPGVYEGGLKVQPFVYYILR
jgi:hypothetical protein